MRSYASDVTGDFNDIRDAHVRYADVYAPDPADYGTAQRLAKTLRVQHSHGIVYNSVRHEGGECVAVFKPRLLSPVRQGPHFCYVWDGQMITSIHTKAPFGTN